MEIVINIPERIHYGIEKGITVNGSQASQILIDAVKSGTPLPKGHGRLIDADNIDNHIIGHVDTRSCPTIIEADREEQE